MLDYLVTESKTMDIYSYSANIKFVYLNHNYTSFHYMRKIIDEQLTLN